jgi:hypothetical protein
MNAVRELSRFSGGALMAHMKAMYRCMAYCVAASKRGIKIAHMLFIMRIVESMGLQVEKPMLLEIDNKGAKDLINDWSVRGRLRHIEVKQFFLRELKEQGLIVVEWLASEDNTADMMTKYLGGHNFVNHKLTVCSNDEYYAYN